MRTEGYMQSYLITVVANSNDSQPSQSQDHEIQLKRVSDGYASTFLQGKWWVVDGMHRVQALQQLFIENKIHHPFVSACILKPETPDDKLIQIAYNDNKSQDYRAPTTCADEISRIKVLMQVLAKEGATMSATILARRADGIADGNPTSSTTRAWAGLAMTIGDQAFQIIKEDSAKEDQSLFSRNLLLDYLRLSVFTHQQQVALLKYVQRWYERYNKTRDSVLSQLSNSEQPESSSSSSSSSRRDAKRKQAPKSSFSVLCKFNASDGELACSIYKIIDLQVQALEAKFLAQVKFLRIESTHASTNEKLVQLTDYMWTSEEFFPTLIDAVTKKVSLHWSKPAREASGDLTLLPEFEEKWSNILNDLITCYDVSMEDSEKYEQERKEAIAQGKNPKAVPLPFKKYQTQEQLKALHKRKELQTVQNAAENAEVKTERKSATKRKKKGAKKSASKRQKSKPKAIKTGEKEETKSGDKGDIKSDGKEEIKSDAMEIDTEQKGEDEEVVSSGESGTDSDASTDDETEDTAVSNDNPSHPMLSSDASFVASHGGLPDFSNFSGYIENEEQKLLRLECSKRYQIKANDVMEWLSNSAVKKLYAETADLVILDPPWNRLRIRSDGSNELSNIQPEDRINEAEIKQVAFGIAMLLKPMAHATALIVVHGMEVHKWVVACKEAGLYVENELLTIVRDPSVTYHNNQKGTIGCTFSVVLVHPSSAIIYNYRKEMVAEPPLTYGGMPKYGSVIFGYKPPSRRLLRDHKSLLVGADPARSVKRMGREKGNWLRLTEKHPSLWITLFRRYCDPSVIANSAAYNIVTRMRKEFTHLFRDFWKDPAYGPLCAPMLQILRTRRSGVTYLECLKTLSREVANLCERTRLINAVELDAAKCKQFVKAATALQAALRLHKEKDANPRGQFSPSLAFPLEASWGSIVLPDLQLCSNELKLIQSVNDMSQITVFADDTLRCKEKEQFLSDNHILLFVTLFIACARKSATNPSTLLYVEKFLPLVFPDTVLVASWMTAYDKGGQEGLSKLFNPQLKEQSKEAPYLILPLSVNTNHWIMAIYFKLPAEDGGPQRYRIKVLDSMNAFIDERYSSFLNDFLSALVGQSPEPKQPVIPTSTPLTQTDNSSCGLHVLSYIRRLLQFHFVTGSAFTDCEQMVRWIQFTLTDAAVLSLRNHMLDLLTQCFSPLMWNDENRTGHVITFPIPVPLGLCANCKICHPATSSSIDDSSSPPPSPLIIELFCGTGSGALACLEMESCSYRYVGIEKDEDCVEQANARLQKRYEELHGRKLSFKPSDTQEEEDSVIDEVGVDEIEEDEIEKFLESTPIVEAETVRTSCGVRTSSKPQDVAQEVPSVAGQEVPSAAEQEQGIADAGRTTSFDPNSFLSSQI